MKRLNDTIEEIMPGVGHVINTFRVEKYKFDSVSEYVLNYYNGHISKSIQEYVNQKPILDVNGFKLLSKPKSIIMLEFKNVDVRPKNGSNSVYRVYDMNSEFYASAPHLNINEGRQDFLKIEYHLGEKHHYIICAQDHTKFEGKLFQKMRIPKGPFRF